VAPGVEADRWLDQQFSNMMCTKDRLCLSQRCHFQNQIILGQVKNDSKDALLWLSVDVSIQKIQSGMNGNAMDDPETCMLLQRVRTKH
jgi:hypothetical protein